MYTHVFFVSFRFGLHAWRACFFSPCIVDGGIVPSVGMGRMDGSLGLNIFILFREKERVCFEGSLSKEEERKTAW
jgi:hypothetical protein